MFVTLAEGSPRILRVFGNAHIIFPSDAQRDLVDLFPDYLTANPGFRAIFIVDVDRVSSSCGYSMPIMKFERYRKTLDEFAEATERGNRAQSGIKNMEGYREYKNSYSIDGLPGLSLAKKTAAPKRIERNHGFNYAVSFGPEDEDVSVAKAQALMETVQRSPALKRVQLPPISERPLPSESIGPKAAKADTTASDSPVHSNAAVGAAVLLAFCAGVLLGRRSGE
jgi:hypothetical protein